MLIVDDNATNRRILHRTTTQWGMQATSVTGGAEALAALEAAERDNRPYDLVLLDAHMPDMDGFSLANRMRDQPGSAPPTVMMLTSGGQRGDERAAASSGSRHTSRSRCARVICSRRSASS